MKWKTRDGREYDIEEMGTEHLKNCMAMIVRNIILRNVDKFANLEDEEAVESLLLECVSNHRKYPYIAAELEKRREEHYPFRDRYKRVKFAQINFPESFDSYDYVGDI